MSVAEASKQVEELAAIVQTKGGKPDVAKAQSILTKLKITLTQFQLVPPFNKDSAISKQQLTIARRTLELACFLSIAAGKAEDFDRHFNQLKPFYTDYSKFLGASENQPVILGLNLMALLASGRLADFHTELELIPYEARETASISFPVRLEQYLMEGSYNKILSASNGVPSPSFSFFLEILADTVRDKIASCTERAYETLPVKEAAKMLMLKNDSALQALATKRGWVLKGDKLAFPKGEDRTLDIPSLRVTKQTLEFATELERIV